MSEATAVALAEPRRRLDWAWLAVMLTLLANIAGLAYWGGTTTMQLLKSEERADRLEREIDRVRQDAVPVSTFEAVQLNNAAEQRSQSERIVRAFDAVQSNRERIDQVMMQQQKVARQSPYIERPQTGY